MLVKPPVCSSGPSGSGGLSHLRGAGGQGCPAGRLCLVTRSPCPRAIAHCACGVKHFPESQPGRAAHPAHPACSRLWDLCLGVPAAKGCLTGVWAWGQGRSDLFPGVSSAGDSSQAQFLMLLPAHGLRQCFPGQYLPSQCLLVWFWDRPGMTPHPHPPRSAILFYPSPGKPSSHPSCICCHPRPWQHPAATGWGHFSCAAGLRRVEQAKPRHPFDFYPRFLALSLCRAHRSSRQTLPLFGAAWHHLGPTGAARVMEWGEKEPYWAMFPTGCGS